ncbi:MAG TPA: chromosomal replication initiator protein DnaA [Candidatus Saccharimonadales bacterium]
MDERLWQSVLGEIEISVSRASFATWFKNTALIENDAGKLTIGVPNIFAKQQLESKFKDLVVDSLKTKLPEFKAIEFTIHSSANGGGNNRQQPTAQLDIRPRSSPASSGPAGQPPSGMNTRYTFDSFIVGSNNELAYAACQAIVQNPGVKYNPLFVYGGVGLGKTHLIQAVGNALLEKNPKAAVVYITSETFVNEFLDSIRFKKKGFADRYRSVDVLIVDDMQFIAGKEKTQEEFFHTFNALHQSNKQIIISSDKPPKSVPTLTDRLRSRFEWGMTVDIQQPDFETRCAILQIKASHHGFDLPRDTVEYLATHVQTNVRELEGALNQLIAYCEMRGLEPDTDTAVALLNSTKLRPKHITAKGVVERTAKHFQLPIEEITGPKRDKDIVVPRQVAMYLLRSELHLSFPKIAHELGRKDHTTAIHSIDKIEKAIRFDPLIRDHVNNIKERLYA